MTEVLKLAVAIQGVNNFSTAFSQAKSGIGGISGSVAGLSAGLAAAGPMIAVAAGAMAVSFLKSSVEIAAGFEQQMLRVQAISGATAEEFDTLTGFAKELGATTEYTATQSAEALASFAMAGFEVDEAMTALPVAIDLATASASDLATTTGITANILRAFGLDATEAARVGDVLTATFTGSYTTIETIGESMKMLAPIAVQAGIGLEEAAGAVGKLGDAGLRGTMAGTGLRQALIKLINPSGEGQETIARLGLEVQTFTDLGYQMQEELQTQIPIMDALNATYNDLSDTSENLTLQMSEIQMEMAANNIEIQTHQEAIDLIKNDYLEWENQIGTLRIELLGLKDEMASFSLDMKKNNLEIMEIRQEADRQGRDITEAELARIAEIQEANDELRIQREKASIREIELSKELTNQEGEKAKAVQESSAIQQLAIDTLTDANNELAKAEARLSLESKGISIESKNVKKSLSEQNLTVSDLGKTISTQVTGTADFVTILEELERTGSTASETLTIFGTRGGASISALANIGSVELAEFTEEIRNSEGALSDTTEIMRSGMTQEIMLLKSAWDAVKVEIGTALMPVLMDLMDSLIEMMPIVEGLINLWVTVNIAPLLNIFSSLFEVVSAIITPFEDLIGPITMLFLVLNPITAPLMLVAWGLDLLRMVIEKIKEPLEPLMERLGELREKLLEPLQPIIDDLGGSFGSFGDVVSWVLDVALWPFITVLEWMVDALIDFIDWMEPVLIPVFEWFADVLEDVGEWLVYVWEKLTPVIEGIKELFTEGVVGDIIAMIGFEVGTGMEGAPGTGVYKLHEGEIVLNKRESDMFRSLTKQTSNKSESGGSGGINIENLTINASDDEGGRQAGQAFIELLESESIRGIGDVV